MSKHTKGNGTNDTSAVFVVTTDNIGKGIKWNDSTGKYDVSLSKANGNQLTMKDDGLYFGVEPSKPNLYVDFANGSDANTGDRKSPFKTLHKAISTIETGTTGTVVHLKENQKHYFTTEHKFYSFGVNASYVIKPYGDKYDELDKIWSSTYTGKRTAEPLEASEEYYRFLPTIVFIGTTTEIANESPLKYMESFYSFVGTRLEVRGVKFVCENTDDVSYSAGGWYSSAFRGAGEVVLHSCTITQKDIAHGHFYLANSTVGSLQVLCQRLTINGTGALWKVGQYPMRVYSSYEQTRMQNTLASSPMWFKETATAQQIFALTTDNNPKSFINNK